MEKTTVNPIAEDRVREHTAPEINQRIDAMTERNIRLYSHQDRNMIAQRLAELDREWDIERVLDTNASSISLLGLGLATTVSRKWLFIPIVVAGFLLQHAIQGWCPPVPILRRLGVRTRLEIEKERYALKALRGDFDNLSGEGDHNVEQLLTTLRA